MDLDWLPISYPIPPFPNPRWIGNERNQCNDRVVRIQQAAHYAKRQRGDVIGNVSQDGHGADGRGKINFQHFCLLLFHWGHVEETFDVSLCSEKSLEAMRFLKRIGGASTHTRFSMG